MMADLAKKLYYLETTKSVNQDGVVKEEDSLRILRVPQEPPYVKMYMEDLTAIMRLPSGTKDLLHHLLVKMDYENMITLTTRSKKEIAERVGIKIQTFDNYLKKIVESGIFLRVGRGEYKVNPNLFARGEWNKISKQRDEWWKLTITYKFNGEREIVGSTVTVTEE